MFFCFKKNNNFEKPKFNYIETQIIDYCNLNCEHCTSFCNLQNNRNKADIKEYINDIKELSKKFEVQQIRILGGEPLLHPDLKLFLEQTRKYLPESTINIVTNGILLPQMDNVFWDTMKNNRIVIDWTVYPIMKDKLITIRNLIKSHNIKCYPYFVKFFIDEINKEGNSDIKKAFKNCTIKKCINLYDHKIYQCSALCRKYYNQKYNVNYDLPMGLDLYKTSAEEIYRKLVLNPKPFKACKYCHEEYFLHKWSNKNDNL